MKMDELGQRSIVANIDHVLGHDVVADIMAAVERAFIASRQSEHPDARLILKKFMVGLLASLIASPDSRVHAKNDASVAADMLLKIVDEMLVQYEAGEDA